MGVWKGKRAESISVLEYGWATAAWALCTNTRLRARRNMGKSARKGSGSCCLLLNDWSSYYDYQFSNARQKFGDQVQLVLFSRETSSVSIGNLSAFWRHWQQSARETADDDIVNGNEECFSWQQRDFKSKLRLQSSVTPYSTDNPIMSIKTVFPVSKFTLKVSCSRSSDWKTYRFPSISLRSSLSLNKWTDEWITKQSRRINESGNRGMITEY